MRLSSLCRSSSHVFSSKRSRKGRRAAVCAAAAALGAMFPAREARGLLFNVSWDAATGSWSVAGNWNPVVVPNDGAGNTFNVTVASGTATLNIDVGVQDFHLTGPGVL